MAARHDPNFEWRSGRIRGESHALLVLPDEARLGPSLFPRKPAIRALAFADHAAGSATDLLGDAMRDLRQVVEIQAEVIGPGSGLRAPVLHHLQVLGLAHSGRLGNGIAGQSEHSAQRGTADTLQRPVFSGRRHDRAPAAGCASLREGNLREAALYLAGLDLRPDDVERVVLEDPQPDSIAGRVDAVLADPGVVNLGRRQREPSAIELAIDDGSDPPAGD